MTKDLLTQNYDYKLPKELIASSPIYPRDNSKLLVYNKKEDKITHTIFKELLSFIPKNTEIFLNDTKVIKARIFGNKINKEGLGAKIELLFNHPLDEEKFLVLIKGKVKIKTEILFEKNLIATVLELFDDGSRVVSFKQNSKTLKLQELLNIFEEIGHIPLPPYMQREDNIKDQEDYQTLFAKNYGAVASPTASLHFTLTLLEELKKNFNTQTLTLHIGAGTFKPVEAKEILSHQIHLERFFIPNEAIKILESKKEILAIGTTVTRTIEYFQRTKKREGNCNLFLHPQNRPQKVNYLLTNFHLPKSTLIMLVSSFIGREKTLSIYKEAIEKKYRFYSYGDAMLII